MSQSLTERYDDRIAGVLSCYDRVVITGTLPKVCYAEGMTRFLYATGSASSITRRLLRRCVIASATERRRWQRLGQRSSTLRGAISARKRLSSEF
jgi:hypothetical protein